MGLNLRQQYIKNLEKRVGMTIGEIQSSSPPELRDRFYKNPFKGLDSHNYKDAKKILKKYDSMKKNYSHFCELIPTEVIDSQLTISLRSSK
ncbi:hypothetical protein KAJ87_03315 [Candidatus Pacearchaeota archaeon]|nr:hypothetical protein [Candidatus Pacearchaeota archaeon]